MILHTVGCSLQGVFCGLLWLGIYVIAALVVLLVLAVTLLVFGGERGVRVVGALLARSIYRVKRHGLDNLPQGGFILLPNHVSYVDAIILQLACPRPIRFLIVDSIYYNPRLKWVFERVGAFPISPTRAKQAVKKAAELVEAGEIVCVFAEGELTRTGSLLRLKKGFELIVRQAGVPAVPVWLDELWGSVFSYEGGKYFKKLPKKWPYGVRVAFGKPLEPREATAERVRQELLDLGEFCYQQRGILRKHLGEVCVRGLSHAQHRLIVADGMDDSRLKGGMLLAAACALSRKLRRKVPNRRVAVVLPPGRGAMVANLAVLLAGKVPANLNFTAGRAALEVAIQRGDLSQAITAGKMKAKLGADFPWPDHVLLLEKVMPPLKASILLWRLAVLLMPAELLARLLGLPRFGDREEAVLLFTSGSSGEPKGVVLSHRNILGNVSQFGVMLSLSKKDRILACLPFFHSFGCTVTLWYPMVEGVEIVTYPSPLETLKNAELIAKHKITLVLSTPTFLRGYLKRVQPEALSSVRLLITGAEKLPAELAAQFQEKFGIRIMEGYGLTETAPVVSTNLPDPPTDEPGMSYQPACRQGSVGRMAPGITARIRDPETEADLPLTATGMLWLRGPNIFEGYLHDPERTAEVLHDGWFKTGDIARFDEDGFLFIEGRLSRFSKIGGEMVPHQTVESKLIELLGVQDAETYVLVITGIPDAAKGEVLVLVTTLDLDMTTLRNKLVEAGLPNLYIPKKVLRVDSIPTLASGKLDIKACQAIAASQ